MKDGPGPSDRYEPLPGLLSIPAFLVRKLGPRGRMVLAVVATLALVAAIAGAIILVPQIADTKSENAARERREAAAAQERRRRELIAEQRPRRARSGLAPATTPERRRALLRELEGRITGDARGRVRTGALDPPPARYSTCERIPDVAGDPPAVTRFSCVAVTSEILREGERAGSLGHPFRARVDLSTGRYAWCKVSGRPGEGAFTRRTGVPVPRACGG